MHYQQVAFDVVRTALQGCRGNAAWQRQLGFAWKCLMAGQKYMTRFCCNTRHKCLRELTLRCSRPSYWRVTSPSSDPQKLWCLCRFLSGSTPQSRRDQQCMPATSEAIPNYPGAARLLCRLVPPGLLKSICVSTLVLQSARAPRKL